jgi:hypothetical protein
LANRSRLLIFCGLAGLLGCAFILAGNIAGIVVVERHNPIADTISDLAAGHQAWLQDGGLILFALGLLACGVGMWRWRLGGAAWRLAAALMVVAALDVGLIAGHNEYGDRDNEKYVIHMQLVYVLGGLFAAIPTLAAGGLRRIGRRWQMISYATTVAWVALAPGFFLAANSWDGAYERFLGVIIVGWVAMLSWLMMRAGWGRVTA